MTILPDLAKDGGYYRPISDLKRGRGGPLKNRVLNKDFTVLSYL